MTKEINRWGVLIGSVGVLLCTGAVYAFSVFAGPLSAAHGWTIPQVVMAFTINAAIGPIPTILGGILTDKGKAKWAILIGGILFGLGFALTGFATSTTMLYLSYGVLAGLGQGFAYSGCLSNTIRLFPDKRGLASGLITAGMGGATIIAAPIANYLIETYNVMTAFKIMGAVYIAVVIGCSFLIRVAPAGYTPKGWTPPANNVAGMVNVPWTGMVRTVTFYLILLMLGIGAFSGLMIASNASLIGQNMFGLTAASAAAYVSIYSLSNCLGRVVWGAVSDRLGRSNTLMIIYTVIALSLLALTTLQSVVGFVIRNHWTWTLLWRNNGRFPIHRYGKLRSEKPRSQLRNRFYWLFYGCLLCSKNGSANCWSKWRGLHTSFLYSYRACGCRTLY